MEKKKFLIVIVAGVKREHDRVHKIIIQWKSQDH